MEERIAYAGMLLMFLPMLTLFLDYRDLFQEWWSDRKEKVKRKAERKRHGNRKNHLRKI